MRYNLFDEDYGKFSEVVVQDRLNEHVDKKASKTQSGHVKIDNVTIVENANGEVEVSTAYSNDIQTKLDGKSDLIHTHVASDITDLVTNIENVVDSRVEALLKESVTNTISFVQVGSVINGLLEVNYPVPNRMKFKEISVLLGNLSSDNLTFNLEKSTDFVSWDNVFNNPITLPSGSHYYNETINTELILEKGTFIRVRILNSDSIGRNVTINFTGSLA